MIEKNKKAEVVLLTILFVCFLGYISFNNFYKYNDNQYREEIQKTINLKIPYYKKSISDIDNKIQNEPNEYIRTAMIDRAIPDILFEFYNELLIITYKYENVPDMVTPTDWYEDIKNFITPYFKKNHINTLKINFFIIYARYKQFQIKRQYSNN